MIALLIFNCIVFLIFGVWWDKKKAVDIIVKILFTFGFLWNVFFLLKSLGYIIKGV